MRFPIRVELEYQQGETEISSGSVHKKVLYNKAFLLKRYPQLKERDLGLLVEERVQKAIRDHLAIPDEAISDGWCGSYGANGGRGEK